MESFFFKCPSVWTREHLFADWCATEFMTRTQAHTFKLHGMARTRRMSKPFTPAKP